MALLTDFYCHQCHRSLSRSDAVDENRAWCEKCGDVVITSAISIKPWILGVLVVALVGFGFTMWV